MKYTMKASTLYFISLYSQLYIRYLVLSMAIFNFYEIHIYKIEFFDYNKNILKGGESMNSYIIEKLKEGRANARLKQSEVAEKIGIKGNTLSNYENGVSEPDIDTFCALCDIYNIDPSNILNEAYGLGLQGKDFKIKPSEIEHIEKYRDLDYHGKKMVDFTLKEEWERSTAAARTTRQIVPMVVREDTNYVNAAHPIKGTTEEEKRRDENIMDDEDF